MPAEHVTGISLPQLHRVVWRSIHSVILTAHTPCIPLVLTGKKYRDTILQMNTLAGSRMFMPYRE